MPEYSFWLGLIKKIKDTIILFGGSLLLFGVFVYLTNPDAFQQLLTFAGVQGPAIAGLMTLIGLIINYLKVVKPDVLPRIGEGK